MRTGLPSRARSQSLVPERMARKIPALAPPTGSIWPENLPRPTRLLDPPEPVVATALLPDHPPAFFVWRKVRHMVAKADGPERITPEWWSGDKGLSRPGLLPRRDRARRHASGSSATRRPPRAGAGGCMGFFHDGSLFACMLNFRSRPISRSCAAPRARRSCSSRPSSSASRRSASPTATRSPASCAPTRPRRETGIRLVVGCRLDLTDGTSLLVYPTDRAAYSRLCRLLSIGKSRGGKGTMSPRLGRCGRVERGSSRHSAWR